VKLGGEGENPQRVTVPNVDDDDDDYYLFIDYYLYRCTVHFAESFNYHIN